MRAVAALPFLAAGSAAFGAGLVNAVAGGGTLISFPSLIALGVSAISSNVTNTVALCPGYFGGTFAQRAELRSYGGRLLGPLLAAGLGGLAGSVLLIHTGEALFRGIVPFLILLACALLVCQEPIKRLVTHRSHSQQSCPRNSVLLLAAIFAASIYGGYFGAGLGIMFLAVLGVALPGELNQQNAVKQALSLVVNLVAAVFFAFSGKVVWPLAAIMAGASLLGGNLGGHIAGRLKPKLLRVIVVVLGIAAAVKFWI